MGQGTRHKGLPCHDRNFDAFTFSSQNALVFYMLRENTHTHTFFFLILVTASSFQSFHSQFSSVAQSCPILCDPMNRSMPGLPVQHHLPESTQTHVHRVSDAIQPSHPLSSPSPPAPNPSQHQSLFQ